MARNEFDGRVADLQRRVGRGALRGSLVRDLPYAHVQHERMDLAHPQGGGPKFQESALYDGYPAVLAEVARHVHDGRMAEALADGMGRIDAVAASRAPKESTALARAGHVRVIDGGRLAVDRPPAVVPRGRDTTPGDRGGGGGNPARARARRRRR